MDWYQYTMNERREVDITSPVDEWELVSGGAFMSDPFVRAIFNRNFRPYAWGETFKINIQERLGHTKTMEPTMECSWCSEEHDQSDLRIYGVNARMHRRYGDGDATPEGRTDMQSLLDSERVVVLCGDCVDDVYWCDDCGALDSTDNTHNISDWHNVCDGCYDNYTYCEEHDRQYHCDEECQECVDERSNLIHDYGYRPEAKFFVKPTFGYVYLEPRNTAVTGFELEMEAVECSTNEGAQLANDLFGDFTYLKYDGSISDGFEMVSHPLSREFIANSFKFEDLRQLAKLGMRSAQTSSCGLHVHINKGFFNGRESSLYRFMSMFYRNPQQWRALAGRQESTYAKWNTNEDEQITNYAKGLKARDRYARNGDRYVALNLQPSHTIEARFFKGTLRPETLQARLESIHAVAEYSIATRNKLNIKACNDWEAFRKFADENGFTAFTTYAESKGL